MCTRGTGGLEVDVDAPEGKTASDRLRIHYPVISESAAALLLRRSGISDILDRGI
jgi:hypothetical protein